MNTLILMTSSSTAKHYDQWTHVFALRCTAQGEVGIALNLAVVCILTTIIVGLCLSNMPGLSSLPSSVRS